MSEDRKLIQQLRDACFAMQMEARARNCGLRICDEAIAAADARLAQPEPPVPSHDEWVKEGGRLATIAADAGYQCGKDISTETSVAMMSAMSDLLAHLRNHPAAVPEGYALMSMAKLPEYEISDEERASWPKV